MQRFKGVASGKQLFREHCATKWFLEANPRNISASKISRYTVRILIGLESRLSHDKLMKKPLISAKQFMNFVPQELSTQIGLSGQASSETICLFR